MQQRQRALLLSLLLSGQPLLPLAFAPSRTTIQPCHRGVNDVISCFASKQKGAILPSTRSKLPTQSFAVSVNSDATSGGGTGMTDGSSTTSDAVVVESSSVTTTTSVASEDSISSPSASSSYLAKNGFAFPELTVLEYEALVPKILNALILALAFGSAIYAILNVDSGMTRGWTQSEIAMRIPLDTWSSYEVALEEKPVVTKTIINVVIYLLGDWLSQTVFAKKNILDFDALRTLRNGFIGLCFGPLVVEYYQFSDRILPVDGGLANRVGKIFMDQTIYLSIKCSIYIMAVGVLQGDSVETAAQNVKDKLKGIMFTAWKFWPLVHCVTYSVIPAQHRILWVNCVDLIWNAILATLSSQKKDTSEPEVTEESILENNLALLQETIPVPPPAHGEELVDLHSVAVPLTSFAYEQEAENENTPLP